MNKAGEVYYSSVTNEDRKRLIDELDNADKERTEELVAQMEAALRKLENVEKK